LYPILSQIETHRHKEAVGTPNRIQYCLREYSDQAAVSERLRAADIPVRYFYAEDARALL
jgi:hypothetical protein